MSHDRGGNMDGGRVNIVVDSPSLAGKGARVVMSDDVGESGPWNDATGAPPPKPQINISAWVFCLSWYTNFEFRGPHRQACQSSGGSGARAAATASCSGRSLRLTIA